MDHVRMGKDGSEPFADVAAGASQPTARQADGEAPHEHVQKLKAANDSGCNDKTMQ